MKREKIYRIIVRSLKKSGAKKIAIFGSYVKGEQDIHSDIDVLVEFSEGKSLLDLVRIERELSEKAGIKVDLITKNAMSPLIMDRIRGEMEVIYQ